MKRILSLFVCLAALTAIPVWAHHSMAGFDRAKTVSITGTVKQFKWANPHSWIEMEVPDGKGGNVTWNVEMTSPAVLIRAGWKSSVMKPGDKVTVQAHPQITGEPGGIFVSVTLADGRTLTDRPPRAAPAPPAQADTTAK
ncbi:MAG TPA: DUF6152 family protein [Bryobacteraceae bacterium]|nr:DUF6152 family protein [Bryobacteraceae bacterium]